MSSFDRIPTIEEAMLNQRQMLGRDVKYVNAWRCETGAFSFFCLIYSHDSGEIGTGLRWAVFTKDPTQPWVQITGGIIGFTGRDTDGGE